MITVLLPTVAVSLTAFVDGSNGRKWLTSFRYASNGSLTINRVFSFGKSASLSMMITVAAELIQD